MQGVGKVQAQVQVVQEGRRVCSLWQEAPHSPQCPGRYSPLPPRAVAHLQVLGRPSVSGLIRSTELHPVSRIPFGIFLAHFIIGHYFWLTEQLSVEVR